MIARRKPGAQHTDQRLHLRLVPTADFCHRLTPLFQLDIDRFHRSGFESRRLSMATCHGDSQQRKRVLRIANH
jgi:hypothetical protein